MIGQLEKYKVIISSISIIVFLSLLYIFFYDKDKNETEENKTKTIPKLNISNEKKISLDQKIELFKKSVDKCYHDLDKVLIGKRLEEEVDTDIFVTSEELVLFVSKFYDVLDYSWKDYVQFESQLNEILETNDDINYFKNIFEEEPLVLCGPEEEKRVWALVLEAFDDNNWDREDKIKVITVLLRRSLSLYVQHKKFDDLIFKLEALLSMQKDGLIEESYVASLDKLQFDIHSYTQKMQAKAYKVGHNMNIDDFKNLKKDEENFYIVISEDVNSLFEKILQSLI